MIQHGAISEQQQCALKETVANQEPKENQNDDSNSEEQTIQMEDVPDHQIIVQGSMGPYLMDKEKWPKLTIPTATEVEIDGVSGKAVPDQPDT